MYFFTFYYVNVCKIRRHYSCGRGFNFEESQKHLDAAEDEFLQGHKWQTETIQKSNEGHTPSFLMVHAQDHVMTAQAELNLIKRLVANYKKISSLEKRVEALEKKET